MRYKVRIVKIDMRTVENQEYEKIADTGNKQDGGAVYGYVNRSMEKEFEEEILSQEVPDIDLVAVIKAVNKIP